ncbi:MAG TPA: hypothetical protein VME42_17040 [Steroidobacteraceae bacterium]|nr:hypothetical protein [Steroidobacteraceae bacterium]
MRLHGVRSTRLAVLPMIAAALALGGCTRLLHGFEPNCHKRQEYQRAVQRAPLKVPPGLDTPNTRGALVIPAADIAPPPPGPRDPCLDAPPRYKPPPPYKPIRSG